MNPCADELLGHAHAPHVLMDPMRPFMRPMRSCRLMEVVVTALGRWADTYLLPDEPLPTPALEAAFGAAEPPAPAAAAQHQQQHHPQHAQHPQQPQLLQQQQPGGPAVLEILVQLLLAALTRFPGETALHKVGG